MIAQLLAAILRILGPSVDEANAQAAAELDAYEACDVPLWEQPYDCPERVRWALTAISDRECPGNYCAHRRWVGRHGRDSGHEEGLWRKGHRRGWEHPNWTKGALKWWCPAHWSAEGMSTVGPHGLIYLFNVARLEVQGNCVPWWWFATPTVSARAARERYLERCDDGTGKGWCPKIEFQQKVRRRRCHRRELSRDECRQKEDSA